MCILILILILMLILIHIHIAVFETTKSSKISSKKVIIFVVLRYPFPHVKDLIPTQKFES